MKLKFISKERPTAIERRKRNPRGVVVGTIDLQVKSIEHLKEGNEFSVERERYVSITENGRDRRIKSTVQVKPKPWWWSEQGVFFLQARFGTHLIVLKEGMPTIECGKTLDDVLNVFFELRRMVEAGELDQAIDAARERAKKR